MNIREQSIMLETEIGHIPTFQMYTDKRSAKGIILVYHGLGADKFIQQKELAWLAEAGYLAIGLDAPHHGERRDDLLDQLSLKSNRKKHEMIVDLVIEATKEVPFIFDAISRRSSLPIGLTGISLGGYITFNSVVLESRLGVAVPILASPDWMPSGKPATARVIQLNNQAPVQFPDKFYDKALLVINAGKDKFVPPQNSRQFVNELQIRFPDQQPQFQYLEYPESEHFMREEDWFDVWQKTINWFDEYLAR